MCLTYHVFCARLYYCHQSGNLERICFLKTQKGRGLAMKRTKMVGSSDLMPSWFEKFSKISGEIWKQLLLGLKNPGKGLTLDHLQAVVEHRNPFAKSSDVAKSSHSDLISGWRAFYKNHFLMECDFSNLNIPIKPGDDWRLLVIANLSLEQLYAKCKELFSCWRWTDDDLDKKVIWNERDAKKGAYAIWVRDVQEADENLKNLSANGIKEKGMTTETLAERLVHEITFFQETGKHLDVQNITLCAGSCYSDGGIPCVDWFDGRLGVSWCDAGPSVVHLRSREVVS
ncbi:MAG: hypothetical protein ACD_11C00026G0001 [uncultured bacterium]|nr:MAG: hypothetical protein ACD_11C00026G0001 [uncultured bacterium]